VRRERKFRDDHRDLPPSQVVALIGSHRRIVWPPLCPACGSPASTHIDVAAILWMVFVQGGEGVSPSARLYAIAGILSLVGFGIFITAREARFLRVPTLTEITRACDFSDNVGFPFGIRRFFAIRNAAFADAFASANQDRLWTDAIRKRDAWISGIVFLALLAAAQIAWLVRG
jgi:hypothetical protein